MKTLLPLLAATTLGACGQSPSAESTAKAEGKSGSGKKSETTAAGAPTTTDSEKPMPKREEYKAETDEELRARLTEEQYMVTKHEATERPWTNKFDEHFDEGIYVCIISGEPLFSSKDKYDSGCGWPAFTKPIDEDEILSKTDYKIGVARTEVRAKTGDAHLGHVFPDGPADKGGMRYCINSASLRFVPKGKLVEEGYGKYLKLFDKKETSE